MKPNMAEGKTVYSPSISQPLAGVEVGGGDTVN